MTTAGVAFHRDWPTLPAPPAASAIPTDEDAMSFTDMSWYRSPNPVSFTFPTVASAPSPTAVTKPRRTQQQVDRATLRRLYFQGGTVDSIALSMRRSKRWVLRHLTKALA